MDARDLASNLEFWSGRARHGGTGEERLRIRPPFRRRSVRARPLAAFALLAGLTAAWVVAGHHSGQTSSAGNVPPALVATSLPASTNATTRMATTTTGVPRTRDCRGLSPARREVRCVIDGVDLDVRLFEAGSAVTTYTRAAGADVAARSGPPACARGVPDERAWSTAISPAAAVGRYRCRLERGRAAMWWTHGDRLAHAVARDADLARLFSWWRAHPSE